MSDTGVIVCGGGGRMGISIISLLKEYQGLVFIGGVDPTYNTSEVNDSRINGLDGIKSGDVAPGKFITLKEALNFTSGVQSRVIIDFTSRDASLIHVQEAALLGIPMVIGSTGFSLQDREKIKDFSKNIPIVLSGNMSLGVNVLLNAVYGISKYLGEDYDCEIVEMHHRNKKDAPSGTAVMLAEAVASEKKLDIKENAVYGRQGEVGRRPKDEIGILSVRGGDIVGEHKVIFAGNDEVIEVTHKAGSRNNFARGAIKAVIWLNKINKNKGLYDMRDVLGLKHGN